MAESGATFEKCLSTILTLRCTSKAFSLVRFVGTISVQQRDVPLDATTKKERYAAID